MQNLLRNIQQGVLQSFPSLHEGADIPERFIVRPIDIWIGSTKKGELLCEGVFSCCGQKVQLFGECWYPEAVPNAALSYIHGFEWLRDLRALGSASARQQARALIESWSLQHSKIRLSKKSTSRFDTFDLNVMGKRLSLWIAHHDFFAVDADEEFHDLFFSTLYKQAQLLYRHADAQDVYNDKVTLDVANDYVCAAKGLLICGLVFEGHENWVHRGLDLLQCMMQHSIKSDGLHVSRSPYMTLRFLRHLLDVRSALQVAAYQVPVYIDDTIQKQVSVIRYLRYADKKLPLMHGSLGGDIDHLDTVISQAGVRSKRIKNLAKSGYTKLNVGRAHILFDHGRSGGHIAPLSFEMNYGRDRMFSNCGSHESNDDWREMLCDVAAHNTMSIDGVVPMRGYKVFDYQAKNDTEFAYVQAAHDAFMAESGLIHRRTLYLSEDGHDLRGEDSLFAQVPLVQSKAGCLRFHLNPKIVVSLVHDGELALLRLPNGIGWRFRQEGGVLSLQESIYAGDLGVPPRKTVQIVIKSTIDSDVNTIKWALQREGV